ncbi:hypothetical protein HDK64DRAFT_248919 [Phyllosticta capitalensis]
MNSMILDSDYYYIEYEATDEDEVLETGEFANEMVVEKDKIEAEIDSIQNQLENVDISATTPWATVFSFARQVSLSQRLNSSHIATNITPDTIMGESPIDASLDMNLDTKMSHAHTTHHDMMVITTENDVPMKTEMDDTCIATMSPAPGLFQAEQVEPVISPIQIDYQHMLQTIRSLQLSPGIFKAEQSLRAHQPQQQQAGATGVRTHDHTGTTLSSISSTGKRVRDRDDDGEKERAEMKVEGFKQGKKAKIVA